jgi:Raf kinase inhibitor-like YbhB/YbcL family protein
MQAGLARVLVAAAGLWLAVGCGADDRAMQDPSDSQTTTTTQAPVSSSSGVESTTTFSLTSSMFAQTGLIPDRYTCQGANVAPPLEWTSIPSDTVELAVVVRDLDANGYIHWVIANIDPNLTGLVEGNLPVSAVQAGNDAGSRGWVGPCPPSGTHRYEFRLHALAEPSGVDAYMTGREAAEVIEGLQSLGTTALTATVQAR